MLRLTDLPPELLIQTLSLLAPDDLHACQLTCVFLNSIVHNSLVLQYGAALRATGAVDNPCLAGVPLAVKLVALKRSERAWAALKPRFADRVSVSGDQCGVYDLSAGVYLLCNAARRELMYLRLPSAQQEEGEEEGVREKVQWRVLPCPKTIIDIGLCLFEHDLLAIVSTVTSKLSTPSAPLYDIEMQYLEFSTGRPHPRAVHAMTRVLSSQWEKPAVGIEIVGEHLVLILTFLTRGRTDDRVFVYDWMNDVVKVSFLAPHRSYSGLIFLTPHLILLPNTNTNALDIFRIPLTPTLGIPQPVLVLRLPELAEERVMSGITCRAEPNPVGEGWWAGERARAGARAAAAAGSPSAFNTTSETKGKEREREDTVTSETGAASLPTRPFLPPPSSAICLFELRILMLRLHLLHGAWNMGFEFRDRFTFVVRREGIVRLVERCGEWDQEDQEGGGGGGKGSAEAQVDNQEDNQPPPAPTSSQPPPHLPLPPPARRAPSLAYAEWGPDITRWFNSEGMASRWITVSAGERLVRMADKPLVGEEWAGEEEEEDLEGEGEEEGENVRGDESGNDNENGNGAMEGVRGGDANTIANGVADADEQPTTNTNAQRRRREARNARPGEMRRFTVVDFRPEFVERVGRVYDAAERARDLEALEAAEKDGKELEGEPGGESGEGKGKRRVGYEEEEEEAAQEKGKRRKEEEHATAGASGHEHERHNQSMTDAAEDVHVDEDEHVDFDMDQDLDMYAEADGDDEGADYAIVIDDDGYDEIYEDAEEGYDGEWTDTDGEGDDEGAMLLPAMTHHTRSSSSSNLLPSSSSHLNSNSNGEGKQKIKKPLHPIPRTRLVRSRDVVQPADAFAERVESALPYVEVRSADRWGFDGVLMDEERVVGVYTNEEDRIEQVEILYFG